MKPLHRLFYIGLLIMFGFNHAFAEPTGWLQQATDNPLRTDKEKARDVNRQPIATLAFFGLQPDMRVVELMPGGGWYSKILGAALAKDGEFYAAFGTDRIHEEVKFISTGTMSNRSKQDSAGFIFDIDSADLGVNNVDMVLTFRNMHNFSPIARGKINKAVFDALKPGGVYAVIDHSKRHMEAFGDWTWRRIDPVLVIKEVQQVGFEFEDFSSLHARPEDELKYDTRHDSLINESDRFTLRFRKPVK